jgi:thiol-disulfide isomerase/thioredoxin
MASVLTSRRALAGMVLAPALLGTQAARAAAGVERLREATRPMPAFTFQDAEGAEKTLADFPGQGLVINLWATWCPPCVAEMPALERLAKTLAAERIAVLPLSSDRGGRAVVEAFYQRVGLTGLGIWLDPRGAAARAMGARGLPTTVIVDRQGQERARLEGDAAWDTAPFVAAIRRLVGPVAAAPEPLVRT